MVAESTIVKPVAGGSAVEGVIAVPRPTTLGVR